MYIIRTTGTVLPEATKEDSFQPSYIPGDICVSRDGRAVYGVHQDGSLRRVKDPAVISAVRKLITR